MLGMKRVGPPPIFGRPGYYYNHPQLTLAIPTEHTPSGLKCAYAVAQEYASVYNKQYLVDVPFGVMPGDLIRVLISGEEYLVVCPQITVSGERIIVIFKAQ